MNEEELRNKIETSIKTEKLNEYLLYCLKNECELNFLNLPRIITENALQRFEAKIKDCQQIEKDLPYDLILPGEYHLLSEKLDILKLKLAMLYANGKGSVIIEENYNEIKVFIFKILNLDIKLKLKYLDLTIKLLEKAIGDSQFNKEFIGALDLIKLFVNEPKYLPNEADLKYISDLGRQTNDDEIRKRFYGIIRELDKKLLLQDLLNQLLKIVKNTDGSPLMQFNIIFITKCLNNVCSLEAEDLNQVIGLVYRALEAYTPPEIMNRAYTVFKKIFNQKKLNMHLIGFAKDFKEKTSEQIVNDPLRHELSNDEKNTLENNTQEFYLTIYFPTQINNRKIKAKFAEAKFDYNQTFEKKNTSNDKFSLKYFREGLVNIVSESNKLIKNVKTLASDVQENLEEFAETSSNRLTSLIKKYSETLNPQEYEETDEMELNNSLIRAKARLSSIKEKLNLWNSILNYPTEPHVNQQNQIDTSQINVNNCSEFIVAFDGSISEKYSLLNQQIIEKFEEINSNIKRKENWFEKSEVNRLSRLVLRRGYFNIDFSVKKIKTKFGDALSFEEISNFISKQSFWTLLLNYGILRWPWMNKANFARTWAEQLCLPKVINETEKLKTLDSKEKFLEKVTALSKEFLPYKNQAIVQIQDDFKSYIVVTLERLAAINQKIEASLCESKCAISLDSPTNGFFDKNFISFNSEVPRTDSLALSAR